MTIPTTFMQNRTADGADVTMIKGRRTVLVWGEWDGATVTLGYKTSDGTIIELKDGVLTANDAVLAQPEDSNLPLVATVTDAGVNTDLNASV